MNESEARKRVDNSPLHKILKSAEINNLDNTRNETQVKDYSINISDKIEFQDKI